MTLTITDTKPRRRDKNRIDVYVNGSFSFTATLFEGIAIKIGSNLTEEGLHDHKARSASHEAYDKALSFISYRPRTSRELYRKLTEQEFEPDLIDETVQRLQKDKYIDDQEYARMFIDNRLRNKPKSRYALIYELGQKGIDRDMAESLLQGMDEEGAAWDLIRPRLFRWSTYPPDKFKKKVMNQLKNRGFGYEISNQTYQKALKYAEDLSGEEYDY